jgi:hypothetical protein
MQIAELTKKKNAKVDIRVPAPLQAQLGATATGTVQGLKKTGPRSTKVIVKVGRKGDFEFRPQDLTLA